MEGKFALFAPIFWPHIDYPGSLVFGLILNYIPVFLKLLAYRQQTVKLLSLQNCVSHFSQYSFVCDGSLTNRARNNNDESKLFILLCLCLKSKN